MTKHTHRARWDTQGCNKTAEPMPAAEAAASAADLEPREYDKGAITRITVHNFLIYDDVTVQVGPRLNLVLGPNGTGKSSIVCALALGLGGSPKILGRADSLGAFVMHEKNSAWIEVELYVPNGKFVVRREFQRTSKSSTWKFNNKSSTEKDIKARVLDLGVQVENLCTFLPQDRVGDFSGYNPKQILTETCKAVDEKALHAVHLQLIQGQKDCEGIVDKEQRIADQLTHARQEKETLDREMLRMRERTELLEKMELIKKRKLWSTFHGMKDDLTALKTKRQEKQQELANATVEVAPLKVKLDKVLKVETKRFKTAMDNAARKRTKQLEEQSAIIKEIKACNERRQACEANMLSAKSRRASDIKKLADEQKKTAGLEKSLKKAEKDAGDAAHRKAELQRLSDELNALDEQDQALQNGEREAKRKLSEARRQLGTAQKERADLKDNSRFKRHKNYVTIMNVRKWIDENQEGFKHRVYGPIVNEVKITDDDATRILDNHVGNQIWTGFVAQCNEDRVKLSNYIKTMPNRISLVVYSMNSGSAGALPPPFSAAAMEQLKRQHGVLGYLDSTFEAPGPVMQVLRANSAVHATMLGSSQLEEQMTSNPMLLEKLTKGESGRGRQAAVFTIREPVGAAKPNIQCYNATFSKYGEGRLTSTVREINVEPFLLGGGLDEGAIAAADAKVATADALQAELAAACTDWQARRKDIVEEKNKVDKKKSNLQTAEQQAVQSASKLKTHLAGIAKLQSKVDKWSDDERSSSLKQLVNSVRRQAVLTKSLFANIALTIESTTTCACSRLANDEATRMFSTCEAQLREAEKKHAQAQKEVDTLIAAVLKLRNQAQDAHAKAEAAAPMSDADVQAKMADLPIGIEQLDEMYEAASNRVKAVADNPQAEQRHKDVTALVTRLEVELEACKVSNAQENQRLGDAQQLWTNKLVKTADEMSAKFSLYMEQMGCSGEVSLRQAPRYADWGIEIRVSFRNKESGEGAMKVLDASVHSGGERSVSTILYLMAMQDQQRSPFRIVDEINQGMDPHNERLVFSRIVRNSCGAKRPQFFLITPKLLQGLVAMDHRDVTVLFIMNGPYAPSGADPFTLRELINRKRALRAGVEGNGEEEVDEEGGSSKRRRDSSGSSRSAKRVRAE